MMKKYLWLLPTILSFNLVLTACGVSASGENELPLPLDNAAWPTPQPTALVSSPTPFPKISLADLGTPTPTPVISPFVDEIEPTAEATLAAVAEAKPNLSAGSFSANEPIAQAQVQVTTLNVRQGPGANYGRVGTLEQGDTVAVLGVNLAGDWAYIRSPNPGEGWVSLAYLAVVGSLADAPVVENKKSEISNEESNSKIADNGLVTQADLAVSSPKETNTSLTSYSLLPTSYSVHLTHLGAAIRPGPSLDEAAIDTLVDDQEDFAVLAVDKTRQWALVKPEHSRVGWVALADLSVDGDLSAAPQVATTWITSNGLILHTGPGIYFDEIGPLPTNSLMLVLGLNEARSWALVRSVLGGGEGWLPLQFITPSMPAAELPVVETEGGRVKNEAELTIANSQLPTINDQPHLVFQLASGGDIMVINLDGSGLRRLTSGIDPALSPNGQTVAFTRWQGDNGSLWTINLDGTNEHQLLGFTKQAKGPAWSPDGRQIVLNYQHEGQLNSRTKCFDLSEGDPPNPPANATGYLDRNGDPKIKVDIKSRTQVDVDFCWKLPPDPHWGLRVVNVADGKFEDVDGGTYAFRPAWDPTQPWRIISDGGMGLVEADVKQKTARRLTDELGDSSPVFSPDGRYLAVTMDQAGGTDIFRLNSDTLTGTGGGGRVRLTKTPLWVTAMPDKAKPWHNVSPAWSPDGVRIAFLTDRTGRWEIWVMNADGSNPQPLFSDKINGELQFTYNFVDERVLSWR